MDPMQALLAQRIVEDKQQQENAVNLASTVGSIAGATTGFTLGSGYHNLLHNPKKTGPVGVFRPGLRMAGTAVGWLLGGGAGSTVAKGIQTQSPAARYYANQIAGVPMTDTQKLELRNLLTDELMS